MTWPILQLSQLDRVQIGSVRILGLCVTAIVVVGVAAVWYRRRTARPLATPVSAFLGLSTVAGWLLGDLLRTGRLLSSLQFDHFGTPTYALFGLVLGGVGGIAGRELGDRLACDLDGLTRFDTDDSAVDLLRSARRVQTVRLPETVEDADGYEPVSTERKQAMRRKEIRLPGDLSETERAERIETRLREDFDLEYVALELSDGTISSLAAGTRSRDLGRTLPPGTSAVVIGTEPPAGASPGDPVDVWQSTETGVALVARGSFRSGGTGRTTLVVDDDTVSAIEQSRSYRLTVSSTPSSDRYRFVSTLRDCEETTVALDVREDGPLAGEFVGWLPGTALAIERESTVLATPEDRITLQDEDRVFLVGRPEQLATVSERLAVDRISEGGQRPGEQTLE